MSTGAVGPAEQIRMSKSEIRNKLRIPKSECSKRVCAAGHCSFGFRTFGFVSDFEIRISDFQPLEEFAQENKKLNISEGVPYRVPLGAAEDTLCRDIELWTGQRRSCKLPTTGNGLAMKVTGPASQTAGLSAPAAAGLRISAQIRLPRGGRRL